MRCYQIKLTHARKLKWNDYLFNKLPYLAGTRVPSTSVPSTSVPSTCLFIVVYTISCIMHMVNNDVYVDVLCISECLSLIYIHVCVYTHILMDAYVSERWMGTPRS